MLHCNGKKQFKKKSLYYLYMTIGYGLCCSIYSSQVFAETEQQKPIYTTLTAIEVQAQHSDGTVDQGYRPREVSQAGPWQGRQLEDLPYSINIFSQDVVKNLQSTVSPDAVYRLNPTIQLTRSQYENDQPTFMSRGFKVSTIYRDGLPGDQYGHGTSMEDTEKLEMFNGLSGFLYGPGNVGGMVNYVSKRPTVERFNEISLGNAGGQSWYTMADFGGKIDPQGVFAYRLNLAKQGGETAVDRLEIEKEFVSLALDWHILDNLLLQVDAMHRDYAVNGNTADWVFASGVSRYSADRFKNDVLWGQPWMNNHYKSERYGAHLTWNINEYMDFRASYLDSFSSRKTQSATNTVNADGTFGQEVSRVYADGQNRITSNQYDKSAAAYLDVAFHTGSISHKLTTGVLSTKSIQKRYQREAGNIITYSSDNLNLPVYLDQPDGFIVDRGQLRKRSENVSTSWLIGDDIQLNERWSALLGLSYVNIQNKISGYDASHLSPNLSIIYKPFVDLTTYATYIESLENGGIAPETASGLAVVNAGEVFDPLKSKQIELGAKYTLNDSLSLNTAIFQIDKGLQYNEKINATTARYVQDGRQIHKGIELTATGKIGDAVTVIGGFTLLDAKVKQQKQNTALEGKRPTEVAQQIFKLYGEYTLPSFEQLTLTGGINYTGKRFADTLNQDEMPAYTLVNLGARYRMDIQNYPVTLRLNVNNILNKKYWANTSVLGDPRTFMFSASIKF
ncbi:TonB-dependent siderophore receptor [Acinetobacter qingfengensis]|uniref:Uncharacterized protein n=1 Tax=Acinetobacter qingfengensis TaxID=1262585 RepID=A0A1E7RC85_9GAMM|nr:TonB-dependent siderophore receptor [Acinetobacter qingfengensis]KAA8735250.1 TonB-dependent siderophore receptor [Acinetobacter qingfengensis]OEY96974.1 hypothetical protein BJI46_11445 [Acinetobacter qingfengensis]